MGSSQQSDSDWSTDWQKAEALSLKIGEICGTIPMRGSWEPNDRIAFAMASFRLAQEHHHSIRLLFEHNKFASANALARPLVEAGLRTLWLAEDASEAQIVDIVRGKGRTPLLTDLNNCLSRRSEVPVSGKFQGLLHNFTHGGHIALASQYIDDDAERKRGNAAMLTVGAFALGTAGYTIAALLGRHDLMSELNSATSV
jgi:hypothetical protein